MHDALRGTDRLPWLDLSRPTARSALTARHDLPLWVALLLAGTIALLGFVAGRISAPIVPPARSATVAVAVAPVPLAAALPPAAVQTAPATPAALPPMPPPPPETTATPAPIAPPALAAAAVPAAAIGTAVATQDAPAADAVPSTGLYQPAPPGAARAVVDGRVPGPARVVPAAAAMLRGTVTPARPVAGWRGRDLQIGAFATRAQADAAWTRVVGAYPRLATLPRVTSEVGPSPGRPRHYRLRIAAGSDREARALCQDLRRIGRGCTID